MATPSDSDTETPSPPSTRTAAIVDAHSALITTPLAACLQRPAVCVSPDTSIVAAARLMSAHKVSSVMLVAQQRLVGIVTDRDLRNRAIAAGLSMDEPIERIATPSPIHIALQSTAFDALVLMARHNIHHVPVLDGERVAGLVGTADLDLQRSESAVLLSRQIHHQDDVDGLQAISRRIRGLQRQLADADASAFATGHMITAITDALTKRLLELGEARFGPPPLPYAWVAAGSQARNEQTAKSDQDNCMILDDGYDEALHGDYFKQLSSFVCAGLDACGYVYCPGEIMAMTDQWRQPLHVWKRYFDTWIHTPQPKALMFSCVFFDERCIYGQAALLDELRAQMLRDTRGQGLFLAHMVGNALVREPPLGLFGGITTQRSGAHRGTVDLKHLGIVPVIDLARVYALAGGHAAVNTNERLEVAASSGEVSERSARDLRDALEFLAVTRIRHQSRQIAADLPADNFLVLDELSNFERSQLKDAFAVVRTLQQVLAQRYRSVVG